MYRLHRATALVAAMVVASWPADARAQAAAEAFPPYFVGEVVVNEDEPQDGPLAAAQQEISAAEIRALGATTVAEAVAHLPGVFMSVGSRNEQRVWLGGYEPANVLVLLDGVPIADPYAGEVDLGQLPLGDVAKIVVSTDGTSALYGPNALGGVINIVTVEGAGEPSLGAELRLTDQRSVAAHVSTGGSAGELDWYLGASHERSEGWPLAGDFAATPYQPAGRRVNSDFARWSLLGRLGKRYGTDGRLSATVRFIDGDKGIPFHSERPRGFVRFARFPEWRQGTLGLGWQSSLGASGSLRAQLYGHSFDNTLDVYTGPDLEQRSLRSIFEDRVLGGYVVADSRWGANGFSAALHFRDDRHRRIESSGLSSALTTTERYGARTASLVLQDDIALGPSASLLVGGAVDYHAVHEVWQLDDDPPATTSSIRLSPQAELRGLLGQALVGSVSVYRRSRFPTLFQLYGGNVPNPALEPQQSTGLSAQLSWQPTAQRQLRLRAYFDRVEQLISRLGRDYPYENQDQAEMAGVELSAGEDWGPLTLRVAGCLQRAEFTTSPSGLSELPYIPEASLEAGIGVRLSQAASARVDWSWVGTRSWYDGAERQELDPYHLLRLAATYRLSAVELSIELANLLDENIEQEWGYPLPGRRLWVAAATRF